MKDLNKILGYSFKNERLLEKALTHRSVKHNNNERLEFLGDAILNFVIAAALFRQFPKAAEGDLSRLRASLVNEDTLALIAQQFELGNYLHLGLGELKSGGARRKSILADALEAIMGAIYLDTGMESAEKMILQWFDKRLQAISLMTAGKDPKSRLQEYLQSNKMTLPSYTLIAITGEAHAQHFHVVCGVAGINYRAEGVGSTRRSAEQMAAEKFYQWLQSTH